VLLLLSPTLRFASLFFGFSLMVASVVASAFLATHVSAQ
jgi:hypothetical protein